jgi:hypothetical protein|tara:strand:- start:1400 stop:1822 length:423 start_codon:yes stop_codon:yes gene_type:complete
MTEATPASMIDVDLDDAKPLRALGDNSEAKVTIVRAQLDESKSSTPAEHNIHVWLDCGEDDVDDIQCWIPLPTANWKEQDYKSYTKAVNRFKEFCTSLSFSPPIDTDRLIGLSGWVLVSEEEDDRNPGTFRNGVRSWLTK